MILNSLMMPSLLAYMVESMLTEAWWIMHMKHPVMRMFYIPPQYLCIPLTISQSNSRAWYQEVCRKALEYGIGDNKYKGRYMTIHIWSIDCFKHFILLLEWKYYYSWHKWITLKNHTFNGNILFIYSMDLDSIVWSL